MVLAVASTAQPRLQEGPSGAPFLLRVAGLPAEWLEFPESSLPRAHEELERRLAEAREQLVEALHQVIGTAPKDDRRLLLAIRRDAFNGRSLSRPRLAILDQRPALAGLALQVVALEDDLAAAIAESDAWWARRRALERDRLLAAASDPAVMRGLGLASPALARELKRPKPSRRRSRRRRLEQSLLRYVSRTVFKLSPFSTLTRLALGKVGNQGIDAFGLTAETWRPRSLTRLNRFVLEQLVAMLDQRPEFRRHRPVEVNPTLQRVAEERYRWLLPGGWVRTEAGDFRFRQDAMVTVTLAGPLVEGMLDVPPSAGTRFGELAAQQADRLGRDVTATLERLVEIGFLLLPPLWAINQSRPEATLARFVAGVGGDFGTLAAELADLDGALQGFATGSAGLEERLKQVWEGAVRLAADEGSVGASAPGVQACFEDVFLDGDGDGTVAQVDPEAVATVIAESSAIFRLSAFLRPQLDFRLTLREAFDRRWPKRERVPLLDLFADVQGLWKDFRRFEIANRDADVCPSAFNPLGLADISALQRRRENLWRRLAAAVQPSPQGSSLDPSAVEALATELPAFADPGVGPCVFSQPMGGGRWVVNRMFEGTGRYSSRFTPAMAPRERRQFVSAFEARSRLTDEREILDLLCTRGGLLGVHELQTPRALSLPGERVAEGEGRTLGLEDLWVQRCPDSGLLTLIGPDGQSLAPAHLGTTDYIFLPLSIQFLSLFGPGQISLVLPNGPVAQVADGIRLYDRLSLGHLILKRRRWVVSLSGELAEILEREGAEAYRAVVRWRRRHRLPRHVFALERIRHAVLDGIHKPQYLDLESPSFVELFRTILEAGGKRVTLEEMLPEPSDLPRDAGGRSWAVEACFDSLVLSPGPACDATGATGSDHQPGRCGDPRPHGG
ncbi:MAG: lantibiotic dehydratase [Acidobacteriota bacterium]